MTEQTEKGELVVLNLLRPALDEVVVSLGWRPVSGASAYTLSRAEESESGTYSPIYDGDGSDVAMDECTALGDAPAGNCNLANLADWLAFPDSDLTIGSIYYYRLDSCNDFGCAASDALSLSVSPPQVVYDAPPDETPELDVLVAELSPGLLAALVQWDVLLTTAVVSGRYTVLLSVAVDADSGATMTIYDEYDATVTLTTALPYEYRLSRSRQSADGYSEVDNDNRVPYRSARRWGYGDTDVTLNGVYYYQLEACNMADCAEPPSDVLTVTVIPTVFPTPKSPDSAIAKPENLAARVKPAVTAVFAPRIVNGEVTLAPALVVVGSPTLTWSPVEGATQYRLFRAIGDTEFLAVSLANGAREYRLLNGDYEAIATVPGLRFVDPAVLTLDVAHYYRVAACIDSKCGLFSDAVRVGGPVPPGPTPKGVPELAIEEFRVNDLNRSLVEADLSWSEVAGANRYRLLRAQIGGGYEAVYESDVGYLFTDSDSDVSYSFTDTDLLPGEIYFYRAQGCSGSSCGELSDVVTLRLQRPGRAKVLFDESGSSRSGLFVDAMELDADGNLQRTGASVWVSSSSVTMAWEETPDADYHYVLRGGAHRDDVSVTVSYPAVTIPIPVFGNAYTDNLGGDDIRHYWTRACNAFGCGELSDAVVLGGGLLGIDAGDDNREVISVTIHLDGTTTTMAVEDTPNEILKTPTNVGVKLCQAGDPGRLVPRAVVNWDIRDTSGDGAEAKGGQRFYRVSRARYADSTSAELVLLSPGGAPGVGEIEDFDYGIQGDLSSVVFHYGVQECTRLMTSEMEDLGQEDQVCSAPAVAITTPVSAFPNCDDGSISPTPTPQVNENLDQVNIRSDLSEVRITASHTINDRQLVTVTPAGETIRYDYVGPEYVIALAAFVVRWDSVLGADYYLVARESRNLYSGESESAEFAVEGETIYEDIMSASPDVVNTYRVQACDRVEGCGPQSDPLELVAPSPDSPPLFVSSPVVTLVPTGSGYAAAIHLAGALYADRYILSRAPKPVPIRLLNPDDEPGDLIPTYTDLQEFVYDDALAFIDDVTLGMAYFYRTRACNALGCVTSEATLITVMPPDPLTGQTSAPRATGEIVNDAPQVALEWDAFENASTYTLSRSITGNSGDFAVIYSGGNRAYDDTNVEFDATYYYQLQACNPAGCADKSDSVSASVPTPMPPTGATPNPGIRGGFVGNSPRAILEWGAVEHATTYTLSRSTTDASSGFAVIYKGGATTHTDVSVTVGQMYYYKVQGCNSIGCAGESEVEDLSVPSMPPNGNSSKVRVDLSGSSRDGDTSSAVTVVWEAVTPSVDVYVILNNIDTGDDFNAIATVNGAMTMHTIDGLPANDFHYYRVRACNRFGDGLVCIGKLNQRLILGGALIGDGTTAAPTRFSATACRENTDFARVRWDQPQGRSIRLYLSRFPIDKGAAELRRLSGGNDNSVPAATPPATAVRFDDTLTVGNFHDTIAYYQLQAANGGDFSIPARANTSPPSSGQYNDLPVVPCLPSP